MVYTNQRIALQIQPLTSRSIVRVMSRFQGVSFCIIDRQYPTDGQNLLLEKTSINKYCNHNHIRPCFDRELWERETPCNTSTEYLDCHRFWVVFCSCAYNQQAAFKLFSKLDLFKYIVNCSLSYIVFIYIVKDSLKYTPCSVVN